MVSKEMFALLEYTEKSAIRSEILSLGKPMIAEIKAGLNSKDSEERAAAERKALALLGSIL